MQLNVTDSSRSGWTVVSVAGEVDLATAPQLDSALGAHADASKIAVDLTDVTFMDSTGLRSLLAVHQRTQETGGELAVVVASGPVTRLLEITGLVDTFDVRATLDDLD